MVEPAVAAFVVSLVVLLALTARDGYRRLRNMLDHIAQLERERERVHVAIHRVARSLDDSLDRCTTLEVAVGTTVDAVAAAAGRARLAGSPKARTFDAVPHRPGAASAEALLAAERAALAGRSGRESYDGWWALGAPLVASREPRADPVGAMAVCREAPFSRDEEDLFAYLAAQTAASLEAITLHERLSEQVVRDELTGLGNHRRFQQVLATRVDEALRSGAPLSMLLLDLDDFRSINAALGHGAGDDVLRAVGQVVRDHCRMTDEPARYAGQQIAVALPGTDLEGAWAVAEDIRSDIAALDVGDGTVSVTGSVGIIELSTRVASREGLIFAAEAALDEAKRAGKNRTVGFRGPYRADDAWLRRLPSRS
jgi:diguanylate cyclase (GGDEF)-like protein